MRFVFSPKCMHSKTPRTDLCPGRFCIGRVDGSASAGGLAAWMSVVVLAHQPQIGRFMQFEALVEMHMMHIVDADQFQMPGSVRQGLPLDFLKKLLSEALVLPIRQDYNFLQVIGRDVIVFLEVPDGKAYSRW